MDNRKVSRDLFKNSAIIAIGQISTKFISFFLMPLYTAVLLEEEYGLLDLLNTYSSLITVIVGMQIYQALFRFMVTQRDSAKNTMKIVSTSAVLIIISLIIYTIIFIGISPFMTIKFKWYLLLSVYTQLFFQFVTNATRGLGDNKSYAIGGFLSATLTIILNIVGILIFRGGVFAMLIASITGSVVGGTYLFVKKKLWLFISLKQVSKSKVNTIIRYAIPLVPNELSWNIIHSSDRMVVSNLISVAANGIVAVSAKFSVIYTTAFSFFNASWTEQIVLHYNDIGGKEYISKMFDKMVTFFASLAIGIIACIPFVFNILVDSNYRKAYELVPIYLIAVFFNAIIGLISSIYLVNKETGRVALTTGIAAVINLVTNFLLIKAIGIYAAPLSSVVGYLVVSIWRLVDVNKRHCHMSMNKSRVILLLVLTTITLVGYYADMLILQLIIFLMVVCVSLFLNKEILTEIIDMLNFRKNKKIKE